MKKITLLLALLLILTACNSNANLTAVNLMKDIDRNSISPIAIDNLKKDDANKTVEIADFSLDIFKKIYKDENILISPLSIISALAMTANGARNQTLTQMESAFGTDISSLNEYLHSFKAYLPSGDKYKVSLANSIWIKDKEGFKVEGEFLQTNKDYYDAEVYKAPFNDSTKNDINTWVNEKTDGQIKELLKEKPDEDAVMYLINALSFDAEWMNIYEETAVREGEFTTQTGDKRTIDFMDSTEYSYIETKNAIGFSKPYADNKYSFVALLPDEGLKLSEFTASLDAQGLIEAINNQSDDQVDTSIPKFEFEFSEELSEILMSLGIKDAFDADSADFSSLGQSNEGNIFINRVIHKTKIEVDEKGTKAGAVTAVEMAAESAPSEPKVVNLNRPFFFMIVDNEFSMPIFIGVLNDVR